MLIVCAVIGVTGQTSQAQVSISVRIGPPPLPVYVQPPCPVDGYLWQPGYWAYDPIDGYYWVPGEWVAPPDPGYLWTPTWWGWDNGVYLFHAGYWGPHVGFYGGINYGFGYPGSGFYGGVWAGRSFRYNTAVFNVNRTVIHNTYINRTIPSGPVNRVSYNGGRGGINRQPTPTERHFASEHHIAPTRMQIEHQQNAGHNPGQRFNTNHGRPAMLAGHVELSHANMAPHGGAMPHTAPNAPNHEMHGNNATHQMGGRPAMESHAPANHQPNMGRANHEMNNAPHMQQHASQPGQHANRMPAQPQQERHMGPPAGGGHMGGGGGGRPMGGPPGGGGMHGGPPGGGGMPHGGGGPPGGGGGMPHGGGPPGGGGHPGGHHP